MTLEQPERPTVSAWSLAIVAGGVAALHATCLTQYGWFRDELYYLSCSRRLAWGYVDHPPLSIAVLALVRALAGDRLAVLRMVAALAAAALVVFAGLIARELGGRSGAQSAAALGVGIAPIALGVGHFYSMNAFDFVFWTLATLLALRALDRGERRDWLALGLVLGLGFLNKWSVSWLGAGLAAAIVLSSKRRVLRTVDPWLSAAVAGALLAPNLLWEARHEWATLEFMHNARVHKMAALQPLTFLANQLLAMGPGGAPIWIAGLIVSFAGRRAGWRLLAVIYLVTLAILMLSGGARVEYLTLACPALFAAGAVWWESKGRAALVAVTTLAVLLAIPIAPFALPILPVRTFIAYQSRLGLAPHTEERHRMGSLPQQYADMFGWPEFADAVAKAASTLSAEERVRAIVVVGNYGEAGALEQFGAGRVPWIACQHNNWFLWGPPPWDGRTAILVGRDSDDAAREFDQVIQAGTAGHPLAMPYEQDLPILIARGFHADLKRAWEDGRNYQ